MEMKNLMLILIGVLLLTSSCQKSNTIESDSLIVTFNDAGIESLKTRTGDQMLSLISDSFMVTIDSQTIRSENLTPVRIKAAKNERIYSYHQEGFDLEVIYQLQPEWAFVSKQVRVKRTDDEAFRVTECSPWILEPDQAPDQIIDLTNGKYGKVFRDDKNQNGYFFLIQNPYTTYQTDGQKLEGNYPAMFNSEASSGEFLTDRACLGLYQLSGNMLRHDLLPEWDYSSDPEHYVSEGIQLDYAEINAVTDCARAFLLLDRKKAVKVHIGWCENDYQIDVATEEGRQEYRRIIDQAAAVGCEHVLYTPNHSLYGPLENNRDAWGWENLLWLGLGQKVRTGEWVPGRDTLPADIQEMLDYARSKGISLMAYVYPSLPFMQDSAWTAWRTSIGQKPEHYLTVDTGLKSFQDWFVDLCIKFYEQTGIAGYSFDHWWMAYEDENGLVSSKYQQWYGTRRILEELRRRAPEMIIDGRQQYHHFGTWTWLAGTYPHPMMSDEQPGSFNPFPDLSTDRISANRQRYVAHRLMVRDFTPIELIPGFITHQTQRSDANRVMRRDTYRTRDWDFLGWQYSLISTIATAPYNLVINYLPARDVQEFEHFGQEEKDFFKHWLNFADENLDILRNIRPIIGQPMVGRCDGTAAILDDRGYVFVFNPNFRKNQASFSLDESIGLIKGDRFMIESIYPESRIIGHPENGFFTYGDLVELPMNGTSAEVLKITAVENLPNEPVLFNYSGQAVLEGKTLVVSEVAGNIGSSGILQIYHPQIENILQLEINAEIVSFEKSEHLIACKVSFAGDYFEKAFQLEGFHDQKHSGLYHFSFSIPDRIKKQLELRRAEWPVSYTDDDLIASWTDPSRLLLFINVADPFRNKEEFWMDGDRKNYYTVKEPLTTEEVTLTINGRERQVVSANNGIYPYEKRTFFGFYLDISDLEAEKEHAITLSLPGDLMPGQFQGLFLGNIENEMTSVLNLQ
jgi:hypothetical protein